MLMPRISRDLAAPETFLFFSKRIESSTVMHIVNNDIGYES